MAFLGLRVRLLALSLLLRSATGADTPQALSITPSTKW
jgi:hypothetical protein